MTEAERKIPLILVPEPARWRLVPSGSLALGGFAAKKGIALLGPRLTVVLG